jgi:hypothetical protein
MGKTGSGELKMPKLGVLGGNLGGNFEKIAKFYKKMLAKTFAAIIIRDVIRVLFFYLGFGEAVAL